MDPMSPAMTNVRNIVGDYDRNAKVLYLALGEPRPAVCEETDNGLLLRFSYETDEPCGVTVPNLDLWLNKPKALAHEVASFLGVPDEEVLRIITRSALPE
jgi:hypothetical protein